MSKNDSEVRIEDEYDLRKASGVIATAEAEFLERIGVGEPDPGPVRDYGSSGSGSAAWAHLAMACMGTEVSPVEEST